MSNSLFSKGSRINSFPFEICLKVWEVQASQRKDIVQVVAYYCECFRAGLAGQTLWGAPTIKWLLWEVKHVAKMAAYTNNLHLEVVFKHTEFSGTVA